LKTNNIDIAIGKYQSAKLHFATQKTSVFLKILTMVQQS